MQIWTRSLELFKAIWTVSKDKRSRTSEIFCWPMLRLTKNGAKRYAILLFFLVLFMHHAIFL